MPSTVRKLILSGVAIAVALLFLTGLSQRPASTDVITVDVGKPGADISPTMFGVFFEDINFAADGGLYPERVKNRSFEFTEPLAGWSRINRVAHDGELIVRSEGGLNPANPHYLRIQVYEPGSNFGILNTGFRGMGVENGAEYTLSAYARSVGQGPRSLRATLTDERGQTIGEASLSGFTGEWKKYEATMRTAATTQRARLNLFVGDKGEIDLDMVSLFPKNTWKNRPNGLRTDLVQLLADMKPGFLRFPGGCIVEGRRLELRYQWKKTVGDPAERRSLVNRWNDEFAHRPAPDYYQTFGLGFFEYFQLAEDLGAEPLPILNCGMACQFNSSETASMERLDEYIQDALDLIEFANGPEGSRWGGLRARMGHPASFRLKMIGIGNEQWGEKYIERYRRFAEAIQSRYPDIRLIASAGPHPEGKQFEYLWSTLRQLKADIVDEHYYAAPRWFLENSRRYDTYDRRGPKVFAGEYAAHTAGVARAENRNNWEAALAEAAFMTGLERNADVVTMASYAPLLAHVDAWQWTPNAIWFDNLRSYGTPNYYVQKLYASNLGTHVVPITLNGSAINGQNDTYASASIHRATGHVIVKIVNVSDSARLARVELDGTKGFLGAGRVIVLGTSDLKTENSLDDPTRLSPVEKSIAATGNDIQLTLDPRSLTVLRARYLQ